MSFSDDLFKHVDPVQWQANVTIPSLLGMTFWILILHSGKLGSSLEINSLEINSHKINSHEINSLEINSHKINSHEINSPEIN